MKKVLYFDKGYRYDDTVICRLIIGDPIDISQALGSNNPRVYLDVRKPPCIDLVFKPVRDCYYYLVINLSLKRNKSEYIIIHSDLSMVNSTIFNSSTKFEKRDDLLLFIEEISRFDWDWILLTASIGIHNLKHDLLINIILDYLVLTQIESNNKDSIQDLKNRYKLRISRYLRTEKKESRN